MREKAKIEVLNDCEVTVDTKHTMLLSELLTTMFGCIRNQARLLSDIDPKKKVDLSNIETYSMVFDEMVEDK